MNLINNAIKFTNKNGRVVIDVKDYPEHNLIYFRISDSGVGMGPEVLAKICQPYGTVNNQNMNNYGSGIGLFTSQVITSQIGPCDKILISSKLKKGSEFSFLMY